MLRGFNNFYKVCIIKKVTVEHTLKKVITKLLEPNWIFLELVLTEHQELSASFGDGLGKHSFVAWESKQLVQRKP